MTGYMAGLKYLIKEEEDSLAASSVAGGGGLVTGFKNGARGEDERATCHKTMVL